MKKYLIISTFLICFGYGNVWAQTPINDNKSRAKTITTLPFTENVSLATTTKEEGETFDESCGTGSEKTVWWKYRATQEGFLKIDTKPSTFDTVIDVQTVEGASLGCNDDSPEEDDNTASSLMIPVESGKSYLIRAYAYNDEQENYDLTLNVQLLTPSTHTTLSSAKVISTFPTEMDFIVGTNANEAAEAKPSCASTEDSNSIWLKLNNVQSGILIAHTNGSQLDTNLSLWKGTKHPLTEMACNEDNGEGGVSRIAAEVTQGQTYYLRISGFEGKTGQAKLNLKIADKITHDAYAMAKNISTYPFADELVIDGATLEEDEEHPSCAGEDAHSIWYKVTPTKAGTLTVRTTDSDFDTVISLWRASGFKLAELNCNDDANGVQSLVAAAVEADKTYYLRISAINEAAVGNLKLAVSLGDSPANDALADARVLTRLPFEGEIEVGNASSEKDETSLCTYAPNTVWLKYTPEKDGLVTIEAQKNEETPPVIALFTGETHPLESKACTAQGMTSTPEAIEEDFSPPTIDNVEVPTELEGEGAVIEMGEAQVEAMPYKTPYQAPSSENPRISAFVQGGKTYFIAVASENTKAGTVKIKIENQKIWKNAVPDRAIALSLETFPSRTTATLEGSTYSGESTLTCASSFFSPHWYKITPTTATVLKISTEGSDFDTVLGVWKGGSENSLETNIQCNDDASDKEKYSKVTTILQAGQTYYIQAGSFDDKGGNLVLNIEEGQISKRANLTGAELISALPFEEVLTDEIGVMQPDEVSPSCGTEVNNPLWWKVDTAVTGAIEFSTSGSNYDTVLSVWEGESHPLTEVGCNDDASEGNFSVLPVSLAAGKTYYVRVGGFNSALGETHLKAEAYVPPANDNLENAIQIKSIPFEEESTIKGASAESEETNPSCAESAGNATWWQYTPKADTNLQFKVEATGFDAVISIHEGNTHPLTELSCMDKAGADETETAVLNAKADQTYFIRVATYTGTGGNVKISARTLAPITNDNLGSATLITNIPYTIELENTSASAEEGESNADCGNEDTNSLWWKYVARTNAEITISTVDSDFDTVLSVWQGSTHPLTQAACNDDDEGLQSKLTISTEAGKTYYIRASGVRGVTGNLKLKVE